MKRQDGIALIATLLIMAAIMALGVGTLFMSNMNLRISENSRTHALARYNAEAGLDAAIIHLTKESKATKQFPTTTDFKLPTSPDPTAITYSLVSYTPYGTPRTRARVVIRGTGPNQSAYVTEALMESVSNPGETDPSFPVGLVSEDYVSVNGGPTMKDAPLHGNRGYAISSSVTFQEGCDPNGSNCTATSSNDRPVSAAKNPKSPPEPAWTYTCTASGQDSNTLCPGGTPWKYKDKPVSLRDAGISYNRIRNGDATTVSKFGVNSANTLTSTTAVSGCTITLSFAASVTGTLLSSYPSGAKVCVTGNVDIPSGANYSDITIVVKGDVRVNNGTTSSPARFNNVNFLSMGTVTQTTPISMTGSRLFADGGVTVNSSIAYTGMSTIASGTNLTIGSQGGAIFNTQGTDVGMAMMAVGDLSAQGLKGAGSDYANVAIWAGGKASLNGGAKLRGGIGSGGLLEIKGNNEVFGSATFVNSDLPLVDALVSSLGRR